MIASAKRSAPDRGQRPATDLKKRKVADCPEISVAKERLVHSEDHYNATHSKTRLLWSRLQATAGFEKRADWISQLSDAGCAAWQLQVSRQNLKEKQHRLASCERFWGNVRAFIFSGDCHESCRGPKHPSVVNSVYWFCFQHPLGTRCSETCLQAETWCPGCFDEAPAGSVELRRHQTTTLLMDVKQFQLETRSSLRCNIGTSGRDFIGKGHVLEAVGACRSCATQMRALVNARNEMVGQVQLNLAKRLLPGVLDTVTAYAYASAVRCFKCAYGQN